MAEHDRRLKQISNAISETTITRRGFVMATLTAGFAFAVLFIRHLTKKGGRKSVYRGAGSIGILGAVRTGLLAGRCTRAMSPWSVVG